MSDEIDFSDLTEVKLLALPESNIQKHFSYV